MRIFSSVMFILFLAAACFAQSGPYERVDTKNLGNISRQDYEAAVLSTYKQNVPGVNVGLDRQTLDNINRSNIEDYQSILLSKFNQYDRNGDGALSRDEFIRIDGIGNVVDFNVVDKNKDGYISRDEFADAMKANTAGGGTELHEKNARQKKDEAYPTLKVMYDEIEGYYVK